MGDMTGMEFGTLTAIGKSMNGSWICQCQCGDIAIAEEDALMRGDIDNCGCLHPVQGVTRFSHGNVGDRDRRM